MPQSNGSSSTSASPTANGIVARFVHQFNECVLHHKVSTLSLLFVGDIVVMVGAKAAITALGVPVSSNFVLAYGLNRIARRFRIPLNAVGAAALTKAFPVLQNIKLPPALSVSTAAAAGNGALPWYQRWSNRALGVLQRYGLAYFLSARLIGVANVFLFYYMLEAGVDLQGLLEQWGYGSLGKCLLLDPN